MGQIVGGAAKPKRCNLNKLSQLGTPAAGEHILVSSDNSMNAAGQGNFDCYIVGNGTDAATARPLLKINADLEERVDEIDGTLFTTEEYNATSEYTINSGQYYGQVGGSVSSNTTATYNRVLLTTNGIKVSFTTASNTQVASYIIYTNGNGVITRKLYNSSGEDAYTQGTTYTYEVDFDDNETRCYVNSIAGKIVIYKNRNVEKYVKKEEVVSELSNSELPVSANCVSKSITNVKAETSQYEDTSALLYSPSDIIDAFIKSDNTTSPSTSFKSIYNFDVSSKGEIVLGCNNKTAYTLLLDKNKNIVRSYTGTEQTVIAFNAKNEGICYVSVTNIRFMYEIIYTNIKPDILYIKATGFLKADNTLSSGNYTLRYTKPIPMKKGDIYKYIGAVSSSLYSIFLFNSNGILVNHYTSEYSKPLFIECDGSFRYAVFQSFLGGGYLTVEKIDKSDIIKANGTWLALGTSRTWLNEGWAGYANYNMSPWYRGYQSFVLEKVVFSDYISNGVNGGNLESAFSKVIAADYVTIEHGVNDDNSNVGTIDDFENNTDNGTFAANYRKLIDLIYAANPYAKIIIINPTHYKDGTYLKQLADLQLEIGKKMSIPVADMYYTSSVNPRNALLYGADATGLHPNYDGYKLMANVLLREFEKVIIANKKLYVIVKDSSDNLLQNINVTLTNTKTNTIFNLTTNSQGEGHVDIDDGNYDITIEGYTLNTTNVTIRTFTTLSIVASPA